MKVCIPCYRSACAYQPPGVALKFVALYPESFTEIASECSFHSHEPNAKDSEILAWVFDALDYNRKPS